MRVDCIFCSYASSGVDDLKAHSANCGLHPLTAERDQLRAEVERLRESGRIGVDTWKYAAEQATARADVAQGAAVDLAKKLAVARTALFEIRQHSAPCGIERGDAAVEAIAVAALDATNVDPAVKPVAG